MKRDNVKTRKQARELLLFLKPWDVLDIEMRFFSRSGIFEATFAKYTGRLFFK